MASGLSGRWGDIWRARQRVRPLSRISLILLQELRSLSMVGITEPHHNPESMALYSLHHESPDLEDALFNWLTACPLEELCIDLTDITFLSDSTINYTALILFLLNCRSYFI